MPRSAWIAALLLALMPQGLSAQPAGPAALDAKQLLGMRLFNQSCRVCHAKPQVSSPQYAPVLSQKSLGGQEAVMREVISNGTPRMPGFKYNFAPEQIGAIVAYLKTVPAPAVAVQPVTAAPRQNARDAD